MTESHDPGPSGTLHDGDPTAEKPVEEWLTGDEPATGAQLSYLGTLSREAGRDLPEHLTKAQASQLIDELRQQSERVAGTD